MRHAPTGYEPGEIGWLTHIGPMRYRYVFIRPGRNGWRVTAWEKRQPETFRREAHRRTIMLIPDGEPGPVALI